MIFATNRPGGMTNAANAIHLVLADYFARRKESHNKVNPMLIAMITDGLPTSAPALKTELIDATRQMKRPGELKFTFFQVGGDPQGIGFMRDLDSNLMQEGAKFDIVSSKTFPELLQTGLAKSLADSLSEQ
jgi:Mg-chelatase subunit ChlD